MLNLGGLFFTLDADTRGLQTAQRRVENFATQVRSAFRGVAQGTVAPQFANQLARQERSVVSMIEKIKRLQNQVSQAQDAKILSGKSLETARAQLERLGQQYDAFTRKMASGIPLNTLDFGRRVQHMTSQINDASRAINNLNQEAIKSKTAWGNATGLMHGLGSSALVVQGHFGGLSTRLFAFGNLIRETGVGVAAVSVTIAGLGAGLGIFATQAISAGRALERLQVGFTALTGNAMVAASEIKFTKDVAAQAGLVFEDTAQGYKRFLASASGVISLQQTRDVFRGISLAAATMQLSVEDTQGVFRALDQMMSKGTVQAEELRGQLGDRLPGAFKIAAAAMGVSTRALGEMMKKGQVVSAEFVPKFTATLLRMWNIDPSKNIDTLQASLNRLANQWTYFGQAMDKATGASRLFKALVDQVSTGLENMVEVLPQILAGLGALTGAFVGLGASMAITALIGYVQTIWNLVAVYNIATRSIMLAATAQNVFNAAILRFPAGRVIGIIANLVITIGTAVVGYKMMQNAIDENNQAMTDVSAIEAYIRQQKAMGFAVKETTAEMMKQLQVQLINKTNTLLEQADELKSVGNQFAALQNTVRGGGRAAVAAGGGYGILQERFKSIRDTVKESTAQVQRMTTVLNGLREVNKLPEAPVAPAVPGASNSDGSKALKDSIDRFDDYILKMKEAEAVLRDLSTNPAQRKLIEDMYEAQRAINGLSAAQISKLDSALTAAGITTGSLADRMTVVITRTRLAEEATKNFIQAWDDIKDAGQAVTTFKSQIDYLLKGGTSEGLDFFKDLEDAFNRLRDMDQTAQGLQALASLRAQLADLDIAAVDTGNALNDTSFMLAQFFNQASRTQDQVKTWEQLTKAITDAKDELANIQTVAAAYSSSGSGKLGVFFAADIGEEASAAIKRGRMVEEYRRKLIALGADQATVNAKATEYLDILRNSDSATMALDRVQKAAEANRDAFREMFMAASSGFKDVISGAASVGDALRTYLGKVLDSLWQRFIDMPIDNWLKNIGTSKAKTATSGIDTLAAGLTTTTAAGVAANDNTPGKAVDGLATAANVAAGALKGNLAGSIAATVAQTLAMTTSTSVATAATAAKGATEVTATAQLMSAVVGLTMFTVAVKAATGTLVAMAASGGDSSGDSSGKGGGLLGSVIKGLGSVAKGSIQKRALGGSALAGQLYQVNESGLGEYFIPSVNGRISNKAPGNDTDSSSGSSIVITTHIDARGATADAIADLKREMSRRDAELKAQIPYLVDSRVRDSSGRGRYAGGR